MPSFLETLLIACIPSAITGLGTYFIAHRNTSISLKQLKESNKQEIDRLMKQHEIDIESLREKHRLEMESKDKEHQYKIELMEKEHELKLSQQENEAENTMKYDLVGKLFGGIAGGVASLALNSPEVKQRLSDAITKSLDKQDDD